MLRDSILEIEHRNRLPTLFEVLSRRTLAPVDLFSFYIYMRDQQRSVDYLDFWLDVSQHMSLCRHYVRELRRSVLVATPDLEKTSSSRQSSAALDHTDGMSDIPLVEAGPSGFRGTDEKDSDRRLSEFLRFDGGHNIARHPSHGSQESEIGVAQTSHDEPRNEQQQLQPLDERPQEEQPQDEQQPRPSLARSDMWNGSLNSPGHTVARADIRASAEKILYTYLLQGSEREIVLPEEMVSSIIAMIEDEGRDDPEVFDPAKDYVFQAMERDAFPGFLQAKALGNLVPLSVLARLAFALMSFGGGFWGAWYVVLRDKPRHIRCWLILPFVVAAYFVSSYQYSIDPVMAYLAYSEYTFMNWAPIREPYVRRLLNKRATATIMIAAFVAAALSVLFIFVPGTML